MQLTRRNLLGGIGLGALGVGGGIVGRGDPPYSHYTYASTGDSTEQRLRIAWYETYNGRFLQPRADPHTAQPDDTFAADSSSRSLSEAAFVTASTGPTIGVGNVLPGDRGTLAIGLEAREDGDFAPEPLDVWLTAGVTADEENGRNGPELAAGDETAADGELDDELLVELWRDGSPLGACNGRRGLDERLEAPIVPKAPLSVAFGPDSPLASDGGVAVVTPLEPGASRCLALAWALPEATATNRSQGDGATFEVRFGGVPTGMDSPFLADGGQP